MARRITKLKVTTTRLETIELQTFQLRLRCPVCKQEVEMLTSAQATVVLEVDDQAFDRLIAEGRLHTIQTVMGRLLVCKESLLAGR